MTMVASMLRGCGTLGAAIWLVAQAAKGIVWDLFDRDELAQRRLAEALATFIWRPLPTLAALATLVGLIVGVSMYQALRRFNAEFAIEPAVAQAMARDVIPLLVGVFASGRVSVGLAARLGGMQLGREILALEVLGHDPARYVLTPSLVAVVAAAPIHLLVAGVCAWFASGSVLQFGAVTPWPQFMALTLGDATAKAALTGMAKAVVFSVVALGVGAAIGAREVRGPADVGGQATAAFTFGLLSVFAAGACWQVIG